MNESNEHADAGMSGAPVLVGSWSFFGPLRSEVADESGRGHALVPKGAVRAAPDGPAGGSAVTLDGATASLATSEPVIATRHSYSVAAWVRLQGEFVGSELALPSGSYAVTAVSQEGPTAGAPSHCNFYLGVRLQEGRSADGAATQALHWCLNVAPLDGSVEQRDFEWEKAFSSQPIGAADVDRWTLLMATVDFEAGRTRLHVRSDQVHDEGEATLPEGWPDWQAAGSFLVGRARWLGDPVDYWPGSIGPVRVYAGVLTAEDATAFYAGG